MHPLIHAYLNRPEILKPVDLCAYYTMLCAIQRGLRDLAAGRYVTLAALKAKLEGEEA